MTDDGHPFLNCRSTGSYPCNCYSRLQRTAIHCRQEPNPGLSVRSTYSVRIYKYPNTEPRAAVRLRTAMSYSWPVSCQRRTRVFGRCPVNSSEVRHAHDSMTCIPAAQVPGYVVNARPHPPTRQLGQLGSSIQTAARLASGPITWSHLAIGHVPVRPCYSMLQPPPVSSPSMHCRVSRTAPSSIGTPWSKSHRRQRQPCLAPSIEQP